MHSHNTYCKLNKRGYTNRNSLIIHLFVCMLLLTSINSVSAQKRPTEYSKLSFYPEHGDRDINPDIQLQIIFTEMPFLGNAGVIRIYDASSDELIDSLDMSVPPGPKNTRTLSAYKNIIYNVETAYKKANKTEKGKTFVQVPLYDIYQKKYIGGKLESDVYHFYPVLINENVVSICPRNNQLEYGKKYYVQIDSGVLSFNDGKSFEISDKSWMFSTKKTPPPKNKAAYVVATD